MARIFTVHSEWEGMHYNALVAVLCDEEKVKYSIRLDEELQHVSSGSVITIDPEGKEHEQPAAELPHPGPIAGKGHRQAS